MSLMLTLIFVLDFGKCHGMSDEYQPSLVEQLGKPLKKLNYDYRELVPSFFSPLCMTLVGKLIVGTVDQIRDPPPSFLW